MAGSQTTIRVHVEHDGEGYHAFSPDLKGLHAAGDTPEEAIAAAREGAALYVASLRRHGDPLPPRCLAPRVEEEGVPGTVVTVPVPA